jgi:hypothetical protein
MKLKYLFLLLLMPFFVSAHGAVTTQSKISGEYTLEFEYNTLGSIFAGDYIFYSTHIFDSQNQNTEFDTAFMRFSRDGKVILASNLARNDLGGFAGLGTIFESPGVYKANVYVYNGSNELAAGEFGFEVVKSENKTNWYKNTTVLQGLVFLIGVGIGSLGIFWHKRKNHG